MKKYSILILYIMIMILGTSGFVASLQADIDPELAQTLQTTTDESILIATIQKEGDSFDDIFLKNLACKRLAVYGTEAAIPALVAMLPNERLNFDARFALEAIPGQAVDQALQKAALELRGKTGAGVIDSIGVRRDRTAIPILKSILENNPDALVQKAVYATLGFIGTQEAAEILVAEIAKRNQEDFLLWKGLADAILICALHLEKSGETEAALKLYQLTFDEVDFPAFVRNGANYHLILAQKADGLSKIAENLFSDDSAIFETTLKVLVDLDISLADSMIETFKTIEFDDLSIERQVLVLEAIVSRNDDFSRKTMETFILNKNIPDENFFEIQKIIFRYLGNLNADENPQLLEYLIENTKKIIQDFNPDDLEEAKQRKENISIAFNAWISVRGNSVNETFANEINRAWEERDRASTKTVSPEEMESQTELWNNVFIEFLRVIQARRIKETNSLLVEIIQKEGIDAKVRDAALSAFAETVPIEELGTLIAILLKESDAGKVDQLLRFACLRLPQEQTAQVIVGIFNDSETSSQIKLLGILKQIGGKTALDCVASACWKPETIEDATRILGEWNNPGDMPAVAETCLKIAKESKDNKYRIRGIRSFIRVPRQFGLPTQQRIEMSRTAFDLATRSEDKILVFDVFERIIDVQSVQAALSYANVEEFKEKACETAILVAEKINLAEPGWDWMTYDPDEEQKARDARIQARKELVEAMIYAQSLTTEQALKDRIQTVIERWK
ncbi:MAG: HEAT repeat domain-containing protein [Planctomycetia bacterium]|nr:HEAT repeat domain-containing protein [Planctomycetia bacterium]